MLKDSHYSTSCKRKMTTVVINSAVVLKWYRTIIKLIDSRPTTRSRECLKYFNVPRLNVGSFNFTCQRSRWSKCHFWPSWLTVQRSSNFKQMLNFIILLGGGPFWAILRGWRGKFWSHYWMKGQLGTCPSLLLLPFFFFFGEGFNVWHSLLMITLYQRYMFLLEQSSMW